MLAAGFNVPGPLVMTGDWLTGEGLAEGKTKLKSSDRSVKSCKYIWSVERTGWAS